MKKSGNKHQANEVNEDQRGDMARLRCSHAKTTAVAVASWSAAGQGAHAALEEEKHRTPDIRCEKAVSALFPASHRTPRRKRVRTQRQFFIRKNRAFCFSAFLRDAPSGGRCPRLITVYRSATITVGHRHWHHLLPAGSLLPLRPAAQQMPAQNRSLCPDS